MSSKSKTDRVIVIKSINFSEADKIISVIGKNFGKYSLIAKGVRKISSKNRASIQTMTLSDITFFEGKELGVLKDASIFRQLISNYDQLEQAQRILLLLNKLFAETEDCKRIINLLEKFEWSDNYLKATNLFILKALAMLGFVGDFDKCNNCGAKFDDKNSSYINKEDLDFLCDNCAKNNRKYVKVSGMGLDLFATILDDFISRF